jgi:hypothetical protein
MSIRLRFSTLTLVAAGLLATAPAARADQSGTRSPKGDKSVVVSVGDGVRATFRWPGGRRDAVRGVPFNGDLDVKWLDDEVAEVSGSCGTGCSATFFASTKGVLGPYPDVLAADAGAGVLADYEDTPGAIRIYSLSWPAKLLAEVKAPAWCLHLDCDSSSQLQPGVFNLTAGGHRLAIRFHRP